MTTNIALPQPGEVPTGRRRRAQDYLQHHRGARIVAQLALFLVFLAIYSMLIAFSPSLGRFMPTVPALLVDGFGTILVDPGLWEGVGMTLYATVLGLAISLVLGSVVGVLLSIHRNAYLSAQFVIDFMRTIPPLALIPVGLLLLGPTLRMEVTLIVVTAVWPVLLQVHFGVVNIDPKLLETARSFRIPLWRRMLFIMAPAVGPSFGTALRLSATLCLLLAVGTELIAGGSGLGYLVGWYQQAFRIPETYATIIIVGLLGVALNSFIMFGERRLLGWHRRETKAARS